MLLVLLLLATSLHRISYVLHLLPFGGWYVCWVGGSVFARLMNNFDNSSSKFFIKQAVYIFDVYLPSSYKYQVPLSSSMCTIYSSFLKCRMSFWVDICVMFLSYLSKLRQWNSHSSTRNNTYYRSVAFASIAIPSHQFSSKGLLERYIGMSLWSYFAIHSSIVLQQPTFSFITRTHIEPCCLRVLYANRRWIFGSDHLPMPQTKKTYMAIILTYICDVMVPYLHLTNYFSASS